MTLIWLATRLMGGHEAPALEPHGARAATPMPAAGPGRPPARPRRRSA